MEQMLDENRVVLTGRVVSELEFSHKTYGECFYSFKLGVERRSGYEDVVPVMVSERLIWNMDIQPGCGISAAGQIRTYNQQEDGRNRLIIVVFARELGWADDGPHVNKVMLEGFVCKKPVRRTSPLGRELCDIMLAVNRLYNKSDYIPCIAWGRNAVYGGGMDVGTKLYIEGRLQSREYKKYDEDGNPDIRTAYEVSVVRLEECE
jgi:single-stranded DNA-binding protein